MTPSSAVCACQACQLMLVPRTPAVVRSLLSAPGNVTPKVTAMGIMTPWPHCHGVGLHAPLRCGMFGLCSLPGHSHGSGMTSATCGLSK